MSVSLRRREIREDARHLQSCARPAHLRVRECSPGTSTPVASKVRPALGTFQQFCVLQISGLEDMQTSYAREAYLLAKRSDECAQKYRGVDNSALTACMDAVSAL